MTVVAMQSAVERAKSLGVNILNLDWEDTEHYKVTYEDIERSSRFIHSGRLAGGSVLVHCAQVYASITYMYSGVGTHKI